MAKLMSGGNVPRIALWIISEFKLNDHLKIDGRKVDVLLLGLRNDLSPPPKIQAAKKAAFIFGERSRTCHGVARKGEDGRLHFTPFASCRISGNRKSSSHLHAATAALH